MTATVPCPRCTRAFTSNYALDMHAAATHDDPAWIESREATAPKRFRNKNDAPICPTCGRRARTSLGRYGIRADCCGLWSWDLKPLVDRATHAARIEAHAAFDPLWRTGRMTRSAAYAMLAARMRISRTECHIALFSETQARQVVAIVNGGGVAEWREQ